MSHNVLFSVGQQAIQILQHGVGLWWSDCVVMLSCLLLLLLGRPHQMQRWHGSDGMVLSRQRQVRHRWYVTWTWWLRKLRGLGRLRRWQRLEISPWWPRQGRLLPCTAQRCWNRHVGAKDTERGTKKF